MHRIALKLMYYEVRINRLPVLMPFHNLYQADTVEHSPETVYKHFVMKAPD